MDNLGSLCARPIFDVDDQPARPLLGRWLTGEKGYMEKPGALGAWQDVPMVRPGVDQQRPGIREHQDLLALIDGQRSLAQLCAQSGLTEEDLVRRLTSLLKVGAIQVPLFIQERERLGLRGKRNAILNRWSWLF